MGRWSDMSLEYKVGAVIFGAALLVGVGVMGAVLTAGMFGLLAP